MIPAGLLPASLIPEYQQLLNQGYHIPIVVFRKGVQIQNSDSECAAPLRPSTKEYRAST